jgi:5-methylcytosine-specific restriction endonuclease McrA
VLCKTSNVRGASTAGLFEELADLALKKLDPMEMPSQVPPPETGGSTSGTRAIPAKLKRAIWQRDQGQCSYIEPESGKRCASKHALQYEHIKPFARGGKTTFENLKLLCPSHNKLTAIQAYGLPKMQKHWSHQGPSLR